MRYICLVLLCSAFFLLGLIRIQPYFFSFAYATVSLLNIILNPKLEEKNRQKQLIQKLGKLLPKFGLFVLLFLLLCFVSALPIWLLIPSEERELTSSLLIYGSMIVGGASVFLLDWWISRNRQQDYSEWSRLLHRLILDHNQISATLFLLEKKIFQKKANLTNETFVIVSGLARSGTTAMTNLLFEHGVFHSLSYRNMPFLLAVNSWRIVYHPKKDQTRQRAHQDQVLMGYRSIEALEEYFFKVWLADSFIENRLLKQHKIDEQIYEYYLNYQALIKSDISQSLYLAKNNNFILRYASLRANNSHFFLILLFRDPLDQAVSLLKMHRRFTQLQSEDSFVLEFMDWLGHHEFGQHQKIFDLSHPNLCEVFDQDSLNYWLAIWINYYTYILSLTYDPKLILVNYNDLLNTPSILLDTLGKVIGQDLSKARIPPFTKSGQSDKHNSSDSVDHSLLKRAMNLFQDLKDKANASPT